MKNQIILYLIVSLLITSHNAIKAQDCTYIYRNDGNINAFFNDNIDSLKYSKIDLNGTPKDTWVTQEIFTADSIYRIPLATIDSIGFITPETIYRPGVIKLEDGLMPYITECDSLTLYLAPSVPKEIIPHKGDRLVTLNMTDILPVGFAGKVIDVRTEKNEHVVECELTPLNDIFEQYYGSTNIPVEPQQASRAISTNPDPNHIRRFKISSQLSANIGAVAGTSDLGIGLSHSVGMEVTGDLYVQTFLIVRPFQPTLFSTTIIADINTENKFETSIKGYASHDFGPDIKANLPCAPLIQVFMSNGIYLRFNGEIVAKRSYSQSNKFIFHYEHNGNKEAVIPPIMKFVAGDTQDEYTEVYGSAVLGLGLYSEVGLGIFDKNIANVTVRGEAGVEIEANAEIVKEEDSPSTKTYDSLNYDDIISARLVSNSSISVKALCFEGGFNTGVVFEPYQLGKWGLVPEFIQPSFIKSPENQGSISATATVGRKCLIPTKVGYALYDKNNKRIDSWENPALYNNELFVMSHRFDNLKSNNEYTVYPYVKLLDNEYLATPNSKVELSVQITTDKASDIKNNSANLTGKIEDITQNDDYTCGFYWSSTSTVGAENGTFISSTVNNGGTFSAQLDNLQPETTYYYRACATINGETLLADNTQSFTTEKVINDTITEGSISWKNLLKDLSLEYWKPYVTPFSVYMIVPSNSFSPYRLEPIIMDVATSPNEFIDNEDYYPESGCKSVGSVSQDIYVSQYINDILCQIHVLEPNTVYYSKFYYDRAKDGWNTDDIGNPYIGLSNAIQFTTGNMDNVTVHTPDKYVISNDKDNPNWYKIYFGCPEIDNYGMSGEEFLFFSVCPGGGMTTMEIQISTDPDFKNITNYARPPLSWEEEVNGNIDISAQIPKQNGKFYYRTHIWIQSSMVNIFCQDIDCKFYDLYGEIKSFTINEYER